MAALERNNEKPPWGSKPVIAAGPAAFEGVRPASASEAVGMWAAPAGTPPEPGPPGEPWTYLGTTGQAANLAAAILDARAAVLSGSTAAALADVAERHEPYSANSGPMPPPSYPAGRRDADPADWR